MATSVSSVTSHFPSAENGFTTTTSGSVTSGATTVGLNSVAGYANGEIAVFVIDPANAKKQTFTGTIDTAGVQVTGVVWTAGTNTAHDAGATVVDYATATHISMISKGILVEHNQDGTHDEALITSRTEDTAPVDADYVLTYDASASGLKKSLRSNFLGQAWTSYTPTSTGLTEGDGTKSGEYVQVGKTVFFQVRFVFGSTSAVTASPTFTLPVTSSSFRPTTNTGIIAHVDLLDSGTANYLGAGRQNSTTVLGVLHIGASGVHTAISSTAPFTWATNDEINIIGFYEAA